MKENTTLALAERGKSGKTWRVIALVVLVAGVLGAAAYAAQRYTAGQWTVFATPTATPTFTHTPVLPTATLFEPTETATLTPTATRSGPVSYVIQEGDTLYYVADEYEIDIEALIAFNLEQGIDLTSFLQVNQEILIPPPDFQAPTLTPMPSDVSPGTIIEYTVRPGDILQLLAEEFNTTLDAILAENEDLAEHPDVLSVGQKVRVPVDLLVLTPATPTRQPSATVTPQPSATPTP
jgi:LysM repeat protein